MARITNDAPASAAVEKIKRDGALNAVSQAISVGLWALKTKTDDLVDGGNNSLPEKIESIKKILSEVDELYAEWVRMKE